MARKKFTRAEVMAALSDYLYRTKGALLTWTDVDHVLKSLEKKDA